MGGADSMLPEAATWPTPGALAAGGLACSRLSRHVGHPRPKRDRKPALQPLGQRHSARAPYLRERTVAATVLSGSRRRERVSVGSENDPGLEHRIVFMNGGAHDAVSQSLCSFVGSASRLTPKRSIT